MTGQIFTSAMTCYRIGDVNGNYPIFSHIGATQDPGRWHTTAFPLIYTSEHYSTALLEKLIHYSGAPPPHQHYVKITIPAGLGYEMFDTASIPDWFKVGNTETPVFGSEWVRQKRSPVLIVPSSAAHIERNFLINPFHPDYAKITTDLHMPVHWDMRLFI